MLFEKSYIIFCEIILFNFYTACASLDEFAGNRLGDTMHSRDEMDLLHLHILFRHGDRTPIFDPINSEASYEKMWPSGHGQLTDKGILQEFELGRWLRYKYGYFIPNHYNASDFHMRSTDIDRTLMSAQAVTAGLYYNSSSPLIPYGVAWRPVPVHTVSQKNDVLLSTASCPSLDVLRGLQMYSDAAIAYENEHRSLFDLLNKHLPNTIDRFNIDDVLDTAICMRAHNFTMPDWFTEKLMEELMDVVAFYWNLQYASTTEIIRLEIGVFINAVLEHITAITDGRTASVMEDHHLSAQHLLAYSAHDTDVTFLLAALGAFDRQLVEYSATVILELLVPKPPAPRHNFHLALLYKRGYQDNVGEYLALAPCSDKPAHEGCPLDLVLNYLQPFVLKEEEFAAACAAFSAKDEQTCNVPSTSC
ncbi:unnamed protein product [Dicrocoelium dendriticum]|nr:unnamed protein product [Dicrocoelium dendriticum]